MAGHEIEVAARHRKDAVGTVASIELTGGPVVAAYEMGAVRNAGDHDRTVDLADPAQGLELGRARARSELNAPRRERRIQRAVVSQLEQEPVSVATELCRPDDRDASGHDRDVKNLREVAGSTQARELDHTVGPEARIGGPVF